MKGNLTCYMCNASLAGQSVHRVNDRLLCDDCYASQTVSCENCGTNLWREEACGDEHTTLCVSCQELYYVTCERCRSLIRREDAYYDSDDEDYPYCSDCYRFLTHTTIRPYSYKPEPKFYGSGPLFMGVELEIDKGGEYDRHAEQILNIANEDNYRLYAKHDGSIHDGFEMVSQPMSLAYHLSEMPWQQIFDKAIDMGYYSHQTKTCGLHIHVSREALGHNYEAEEDAIARIIFFVEKHWDKLLIFSRRSEENMSRWASRYGVSDNAKNTYANAKKKFMGRYVAVNLENDETIEFRLFRGTLRYSSFAAALQLVSDICNLAIRLKDEDLEQLDWTAFVKSIPEEHTELIEYLKEKGLYEEGEER